MATSGSLVNRLKAMGFVSGARVEILRDHPPFPLHVRVGSTEFMVRRKVLPMVLRAVSPT